jgi:hypothetical protein
MRHITNEKTAIGVAIGASLIVGDFGGFARTPKLNKLKDSCFSCNSIAPIGPRFTVPRGVTIAPPWTPGISPIPF